MNVTAIPQWGRKDIYHFPFHSFNYIHGSLRSSCHRNFDGMDYYLTTMALIQAWPIVMAFAYGLVPNKAANVRLIFSSHAQNAYRGKQSMVK